MRIMYISLFMILLSTEVVADNYVECYDCTSTEMTMAARGWTDKNMTVSESLKGVTKNVNVIDIVKNKIETYNVKLIYMPLPEGFPGVYIPSTKRVYTPHHIKSQMTPLIEARNNLKRATRELKIPESVIEAAWQTTNCAFCENNIQTYVNSSLAGERISVQVSLAAIAHLFGLTQTGLPDTYRINLDAGGYVEVKMSITAESSKLKVTLSKAVDGNGNTVPSTASGLNNLLIQVPSMVQANNINIFINKFNFYVPVKMGYVVIKECLRKPEGNYPRCG